MNNKKLIKQRNIIFRSDAGPTIGMGHFIRTLALAEMLKEDFRCVYATRKPTDYQIAEIEKICHSRIDLQEDDTHFDQFLSLLKGDEIVVLDNYFFDTDYQRAIKAKGCKLVCIDDMHDKHYVADVVINHAPIDRKQFSVEPYTQLLLGFEYALLRPDFLNNSAKPMIKKGFEHALICMGGADFNNLTNAFLKDLINIESIKKISIITGNAYQFAGELEETINSCCSKKTIAWHKSISSAEVKNLMSTADFGVVPCSTVLLESVSQCLPVISGYYVDNQIEIAKSIVDKYPHIKILGNLNQKKISEEKIIELSNIIFNIEIPHLISRQNKRRMQKEFNALSIEMSLKIKCAKSEDVDLYYQWANDPRVRMNAIHPETIKYENHVLWYNKKLESETTYIFTFYTKHQPIGQVRFELEDDHYLIDYSIDSKHRGKGYGRVLIKMGIEQLQQSNLKEDIKLKALVKNTNPASSKVFESLQFLQTDTTNIFGSEYFIFEK